MRNASFRTKVGRVSDSRPTRTLGRIEEYAYISLTVQLSLPDLSDFVRLVRLLSDMSDMSDTVRLLSDLSEIPGPAQTSRTGHSGSFYTATNLDEFRRIQSRNSIEFVDLFLTPLNFTEFSGCSPLNSPEFREIPHNRVCIE